MIRLEDREFENSVFDRECPLAVPVQITLDRDGSFEMLVYSFCRETAEAFEARFAADPLGEEAITWLAGELTRIMEPLGYDELDIESYPLHDYRPEKIREDVILPECQVIDTLEGERWDSLPLDEFALNPADPADRMAVIRDGAGKIVCYAGLNDISAEEGLYELTVECEESFRRRGYGASCTALLASRLEALGEGSQYVTSHRNIPSVRCAERAGFRRRKSVFPFVFRKSGVDDAEFFDFT